MNLIYSKGTIGGDAPAGTEGHAFEEGHSEAAKREEEAWQAWLLRGRARKHA